MKQRQHSKRQVAIMFSGGRDSTLVAAYYAEHNYQVTLLTFNNGTQSRARTVACRIAELRKRWPNSSIMSYELCTTAHFRAIALQTIVDDIVKYRLNLVCLGSALSMLVKSITYCITHRIKFLAAGYSSYQSRHPEQTRTAIGILKTFARRYGITFNCPHYLTYQSERDVKQTLDILGLSTKALETNGLWDWTFSENVPEEIVSCYLKSKLSIAASLLERQIRFRNPEVV